MTHPGGQRLTLDLEAVHLDPCMPVRRFVYGALHAIVPVVKLPFRAQGVQPLERQGGSSRYFCHFSNGTDGGSTHDPPCR